MCTGLDVYFWRQSLILYTEVLASITGGVMVAFPGVMNPSLLRSNGTDIRANASQASWIAASNGFAGMIGCLILPTIMQTFGRKTVNIFTNFLFLGGWIIFVFAKNISALFAARIIQGIGIGSFITSSIMISEYTDPTRRGYFMVLKKMTLYLGVLFCHVTAMVWSWRQIAWFCTVISSLAIIMTFFWPESPAYLALKGRFEECEKSYFWLRGYGMCNRKELTDLISKQRKQNNTIKRKEKRVVTFLKIFKQKDFLKAFFVSVLLALVIESCGRHFFVAYAIQIMVELLGEKAHATYYTLGVDCLTILALVIACFAIKSFKRRTLLFTFGSMSALILFSMSVLLYLKESVHIKLLTPSLVMLFSFVANVGVIPICFSVTGEIFSLEHRGAGVALTGIVLSFIYAITLRVTPILIKATGLGGTFAACGLCVTLCLVLLVFTLPETKDRTLLDIESEMKGVKRSRVETEPMLSPA